MCQLFWNLEASNSWNPQGLFSPVMGLLYLYLYLYYKYVDTISCSIQIYCQDIGRVSKQTTEETINPLNAELNPTCHLLALLGVHHFLHVSRIRVNKKKSKKVFFFFTLVTNGHNRQFIEFCSYPVTNKPPALDNDRVKASARGSALTQMRGDRLFASHCVNICRFYQPSQQSWWFK